MSVRLLLLFLSELPWVDDVVDELPNRPSKKWIKPACRIFNSGFQMQESRHLVEVKLSICYFGIFVQGNC